MILPAVKLTSSLICLCRSHPAASTAGVINFVHTSLSDNLLITNQPLYQKTPDLSSYLLLLYQTCRFIDKKQRDMSLSSIYGRSPSPLIFPLFFRFNNFFSENLC